MKYLFTVFVSLILFTLLPNTLQAENGATRNPDKTIKFHLKASDSITTISNFNSIKIIDLRKNKDTIGKHFSRHDIYSIVSNNLPEMVATVGTQIIQPASIKRNQQLLMVIKDIDIMSLERNGFIHFKVDFYISNANQYQLISRMDSLYQYSSRHYMPEHSLEYLNNVITYSIIDCATKILPSNEALLDSATIVNEEKTIKNNQPVYSEPPKDGVYYTYNDFVANKPSDTAFVYEPYYFYDQRVERFYLPAHGNKKGISLADTICFAICYKGKWYKNFGGDDFKQMKMENGDFVYLTVLPALRYFGSFLKPDIHPSVNNANVSKPVKVRKLKYEPQIYKIKIDAITGKGYKIKGFPEYLNVDQKTLHL